MSRAGIVKRKWGATEDTENTEGKYKNIQFFTLCSLWRISVLNSGYLLWHG